MKKDVAPKLLNEKFYIPNFYSCRDCLGKDIISQYYHDPLETEFLCHDCNEWYMRSFGD